MDTNTFLEYFHTNLQFILCFEFMKIRTLLILVIDNEAQQRDLASKILGVYGYRIHTVASGEEAVKSLKTHESDLLLLDLIMDPGINGYETYRQILKTRPNQKAIIVSGYSESLEVKKAKELGILGACPRMPFRSLVPRLPAQTLRYLQKIMLGILTICLCLFCENASILNKTPILGQAPRCCEETILHGHIGQGSERRFK